MKIMKKLKVILIGAGGRGNAYTSKMTEDKFEIVAVAETNEARRKRFQGKFNIPDEMCFDSWEKLLELPKFADVVIIATSDSMHYFPAMKAIEQGYDLLLEKPVAPTPKECVDIANFAKEKGVKVLVCHVLRYTPFFSKIKEMLNNNAVGKILSIHHDECVGNIHYSHSYVRGNWGNTARSSNMLLAKSCHDMDILQWLLDSKCTFVQSFGTLSHFRKENAPEGTPEYCYQDCPYKDTCYYDATSLYSPTHPETPAGHALQKDNPTKEDYDNLLQNTQYGKCVFHCDNDVVDHQVVNLEYENGAVASFNMSAFNAGGRHIRIMGTDGEIYGDMDKSTIDYFDFKTRKHHITTLENIVAIGHHGGDAGIVNTLYEYLVNDYDGDMLSEIGISVENHLTTFAAEQSRLDKKVISVPEYSSNLGFKC